MLDLYLVRHAQTPPNAQGRYPSAHSVGTAQDAPLSAEGVIQVRALRLPQGGSPQVWSSPALRCLQTARLAGYEQPQLTAALQEADFGLMAGHTWSSLEAHYGDLPRRWVEALSDPRSLYGPPEGETGQQFHLRLQSWLNDLPQQGGALAFAHAGSILGILRLTVNLSAAQIQHAKVTHLRRAGGQWWLETLNA